jgi:hypothetical protein
MDDGFSGNFVSIIGFQSHSKVTTVLIQDQIIKGRQHRFKYRAKNSVGWGPFSEESAILAARVPDTPDRPVFEGFADGKLQLYIPESEDNGGTDIIGYELYVDAGDDFTSEFTKLEGYTGESTVYEATEADGLELGKTYRFESRAENLMGFSELSTASYIAFGAVPNVPDPPSRTASSPTSISVEWSAPATGDLDVSGYILNMDDGFKTDLLPIYIGYNRPDVLSFTIGGLTTGLPYRFSV